ncbi:phosphatase PAP2 family protein [Escherichia fergusonii]|uniref:phosphatase PAP2 family protein n=1 Tax=Escherichia fergusonii TaxID=564 RepID=UPI001CBA8671|nr:phosphatase PAP2 family protein [Escherichia fergusonii]MBZ4072283.1 phosphatase PAP2 family protein [Escherichia fergusonii]MBZ4081362.1 phosphatase PAP2 family protein [Escherichia fergusonii]MBZ4085103.1 phosphatase PAP2 family protein [Escherichia fergusonii]MBZ4090376.1 phosphatase PAP2 family protein [Escherichia fergusonii]MBZ4093952.1 phosphatase PAP2 family protein [Escherichia fergusonii]
MKIQLNRILLLNLSGMGLFLSWYLPSEHGIWAAVDSGIIHYFNHKVIESQPLLWLVAITNNRAFDGCSLLAMGGLMLWFWLQESKAGRRRIVIIGLVMLLAAVILNQLGQALIPVKRASPTLTFSDIVRVSELSQIPTKDASRDSFPGDHGMMLLIFSAFMWRYFGKIAGIIGLIIFVVFAFPRVMIGAHWFTDIAVGSLTVILIGLPWWLMTPLSDRLISLFGQYLPGKNKQTQNK